MSVRTLLLTVLLCPAVGHWASAQYVAYPVYGGTTPAGSALTGASNVIQAQGSYNLQTSQAAINLTQARSMNLDNQLKATQTYYEQRRIHDDFKKAEYDKDRRTADDYRRYAHAAAPKRLSYSQLDPITGNLNWPPVLTDDEYSEDRQELDKLFAERAKAGGAIGYSNATKIRKTSDSLAAKLKSNIGSIPTGDYIAAKNFLTSVSTEASFPAE